VVQIKENHKKRINKINSQLITKLAPYLYESFIKHDVYKQQNMDHSLKRTNKWKSSYESTIRNILIHVTIQSSPSLTSDCVSELVTFNYSTPSKVWEAWNANSGWRRKSDDESRFRGKEEGVDRFLVLGRTHMTAPQELRVFHQRLLGQLFVKQVVHFSLQAVPQLQNNNKLFPSTFSSSFPVFKCSVMINSAF